MRYTSKIIVAGLLIAVFGLSGCHKKKRNPRQSATTMIQGTMRENAIKASKSNFITHLKQLPGVTNAKKSSGEVLLKIGGDSTQIYYTVNLSRVDSVTMVHLRYGHKGENGPIAVWLYPAPDKHHSSLRKNPVNGMLKSGMINPGNLLGHFKGKHIKDLIAAIRHDSIYAQVDTKTHPRGEMYGQLKVQHK